MTETSYGSDAFRQACHIDATCRTISGNGPRPVWARLRASSILLARYHARLPVTELRLTGAPAGRMIGEHFSIREGRGDRYGKAQGVLPLPDEFADYMRGRSRQAVRTNIGHAKRSGQFVLSYAVDGWAPGSDDSRSGAITPGPVERWNVLDKEGRIIADSIVSIDREVALLHGLVSEVENARWLLHTELVERLCGECRVLVTNGDEAYRLTPGNQHFQRLLGYEVSRLRVSHAPVGPDDQPPQPAALPWPPGVHSCGIPAPQILEAQNRPSQ